MTVKYSDLAYWLITHIASRKSIYLPMYLLRK